MTVDVSTLPRLPLIGRNKLPRCSAVYFAVDESNAVLYIGQAVDIKRRWAKQYRRFPSPDGIYIAWLEVQREHLRFAENELIQHFRPSLNWVGAVTASLRLRGLPDPLITQIRKRGAVKVGRPKTKKPAK